MKKSKIDMELVNARLKDVQDPELRRSLVDLGMVEEVRAKGDKLFIKIRLTIPGCPLKNRIAKDIESAVSDIPGVAEARIEFSSMSAEERQSLARRMTVNDPSEIFKAKGVKNVILVASGKGGVGKSTVAANLAVAIAQLGFSVGILDADIYGFSIPRILGVDGHPTVLDKAIIPLEKHGLRIISMGFFVDDNEAVIWRGPMVHKAVSRFLSDVFWDDLDILFIDLPPGTGDVALSLSQIVKGVKAILVTTPQPGAYIVASRIGKLVDKFSIKMLGIIENMSYFLDPTGGREYIFGSGGGQELSERMGIPLLGQIPLEKSLRAAGDKGVPLVLSDSESPAADEIKNIASRVITILEINSRGELEAIETEDMK